MLVSLIIGALSIVYALIFCSGTFTQLAQVRERDDAVRYPEQPATGAKAVFNASQSFSDLFLILGVVLILVAVLLYVAACQKRRKYYITNYVAIGIAVVYQLVFVILLIVKLVDVQNIYNAVNLENCRHWYDNASLANGFGKFSTNAWTVTLGYVLAAVVLVNMLLLIGNVVWKVMLMKGEKKLLENGLVKEVA